MLADLYVQYMDLLAALSSNPEAAKFVRHRYCDCVIIHTRHTTISPNPGIVGMMSSGPSLRISMI